MKKSQGANTGDWGGCSDCDVFTETHCPDASDPHFTIGYPSSNNKALDVEVNHKHRQTTHSSYLRCWGGWCFPMNGLPLGLNNHVSSAVIILF